MKTTLKSYIELLWVMTEKELKVRYKYTLLGFLWMIINPLFQMFVIGVIFTSFMKQPIQHYFYFLFLNLLVWNFISLSLSRATQSIVTEREMIKKAPFPRSIIPLSIIFSNMFHMLIGIFLYVIPIITLGTVNILVVPVVLLGGILLLLLTVGISLLTSALNVKFRDMGFLIQAILTLWFYSTPIVYSLELIPHKLIWLWMFNPLVTILQLFQFAFLSFPMPTYLVFIMNISIIVFLFILGIYLFNRESRSFDDLI